MIWRILVTKNNNGKATFQMLFSLVQTIDSKIDSLNNTFSEQRKKCEGRFTTLETERKVTNNIRRYRIATATLIVALIGTISGAAYAIITLFRNGVE